MTSTQQFFIQMLSTFAVLIPVLVNAFKTYRNASDADTRLKSLEEWQKAQDAKLLAIKEDQGRAFKEQGEHRYRLDKHLAVLEDRLSDTKRKVESIPSRSEFGYRRDQTQELTPLPAVAPRQEPITDPFDPYPDVDEEFKPKRKKR